ncbi:MAG: type I 3-dehydroquinate dehydratase [Phycisphaerae bacterium]|nr:type I 3-dehydroquinate dehydratase [Phycisphaerae bacterium]
MTELVVSVAGDDLDALRRRAERAFSAGAQLVELRIDSYQGDAMALADYLRTLPGRHWIVTCRASSEGGRCSDDQPTRMKRLLDATRDTDALIDFELAEWERSAEARESYRKERSANGHQRRLILSMHDRMTTPDQAAGVIRRALLDPEVLAAKMAYNCDSVHDSFLALDLMRQNGPMVVAIAKGEAGLWTRLLARKLNSFATYCALRPEWRTAEGQFTLEEMTQRFRWSAMTRETKVFGVLADPVMHSMGPVLFNHWFAEERIDAVYVPVLVRPTPGNLRRFLDGCLERDWLNVGGFSVTLPHKELTLRWLGDRADRQAAAIGAVNTVVLRDGEAKGFNTDCYAAIDSLCEALGRKRTQLVGLRVDVLGTGGAARALLAGLSEFGATATVYGRSAERREELAATFGCKSRSWEDRELREGEVLVNCTNVGMAPDVDASPMPEGSLSNCRLVFDLVYHPLETKLLRTAREAGVPTLDGLDMFVRQAMAQFALWLGKSPSKESGRSCVMAELARSKAAAEPEAAGG